MEDFKGNAALFKFQYLPDYAKFLLDNKLEEFVLVGIRFCRELDLPMMRPLSRLSEKELLDLSREGNRVMLQALAQNNVLPVIEENIKKFVANDLKDLQGRQLMDNTDVVAEDIILGFYVRRKLFAYFLYSYTQNAVIHTLIIAEVDAYATNEHLLTTKAFIRAQENSVAK